MSSVNNNKGLYFYINEYKSEITHITLIVACVALMIFLAVKANQETCKVGDESWTQQQDYFTEVWDPKTKSSIQTHCTSTSNLSFTAYTKVGSLYIAGSLASAMTAVTLFIRAIYNAANPQTTPLQGNRPPCQQKVSDYVLKSLGFLLLYGAIFGCVYLAVQASHTVYLTSIRDTDYGHINGKDYNITAYTNAGSGMVLGSIFSGLAIPFTVALAAYLLVKRATLAAPCDKLVSKEELAFLRGNKQGEDRTSDTCMERIRQILFSRNGTYSPTRIADLRSHLLTGEISRQEIEFLDETFYKYHTLKSELEALNEEQRLLPQEIRPPTIRRNRSFFIKTRIAEVQAQLHAVRQHWITKEEGVFSGSPGFKPKPSPTVVDMPTAAIPEVA